MNVRGDLGWTPLIQAVSGDTSVRVVEYLLLSGADTSITDDFGNGALHRALWTNSPDLEIIHCLVKHGTDYTLRNLEGWTPLEDARRRQAEDIRHLEDTQSRDTWRKVRKWRIQRQLWPPIIHYLSEVERQG